MITNCYSFRDPTERHLQKVAKNVYFIHVLGAKMFILSMCYEQKCLFHSFTFFHENIYFREFLCRRRRSCTSVNTCLTRTPLPTTSHSPLQNWTQNHTHTHTHTHTHNHIHTHATRRHLPPTPLSTLRRNVVLPTCLGPRGPCRPLFSKVVYFFYFLFICAPAVWDLCSQKSFIQ